MRRVLILVAAAGLLTGCTGYLWGDNTYGQLGNGTTTGSAMVPTAEPSGSDWYVLAAGDDHVCGVQVDRSLWCWGRNRYGTIGNGAGGLGTPDEPSPVQVGSAIDWRLVEGSVAGGRRNTCAIDRSKQLWCWGDNGSGQVGDGTVTDRFTPVQVGSASDWTQVTAGPGHVCGIRNTDQLYCWGDNGFGQLGVGDFTDRITPTQVAGSWSDVDAGALHTCAITTIGELYCWGSNSSGQIGQDSSEIGLLVSPAVPEGPTGSFATWTDISAGRSHTCGVQDQDDGEGVITGMIFCAGSDSVGQIGNGLPDADNIYDSFTLSGGSGQLQSGWSQVSAGDLHNCALRSGDMWCWGDNDFGELGNNTSGNRYQSPTAVSLQGDWISVSASQRFTVGLRNEN